MKLIPKQRILPNGTKDEVSDGKLIKRVNEVVLDGSENWLTHQSSDTYISFCMHKSDIGMIVGRADYRMIMAAIPVEIWVPPLQDKHYIWVHTSTFGISVKKEWLITQDVAGFKVWLQANPITLTYQLARPKIYQSKFIY